VSNFHAIPLKLRDRGYFSKLNYEVWIRKFDDMFLLSALSVESKKDKDSLRPLRLCLPYEISVALISSGR
jgi:hypothetical protein